jgi:Tyrosine phosphatase family
MKKHFPFLRRLRLKTVLTLVMESYPPANEEFHQAEGIRLIQVCSPKILYLLTIKMAPLRIHSIYKRAADRSAITLIVAVHYTLGAIINTIVLSLIRYDRLVWTATKSRSSTYLMKMSCWRSTLYEVRQLCLYTLAQSAPSSLHPAPQS